MRFQTNLRLSSLQGELISTRGKKNKWALHPWPRYCFCQVRWGSSRPHLESVLLMMQSSVPSERCRWKNVTKRIELTKVWSAKREKVPPTSPGWSHLPSPTRHP